MAQYPSPRSQAEVISPASDLRLPTPLRHLLVKADGRMHCLRIREIDWCLAEGNYVQIHLGPRSFQIRSTLAEICKRLTAFHFSRISRTTVVNIDRISEIQPTGTGAYDVLLHGGRSWRLTRGYRDNFMERFCLL